MQITPSYTSIGRLFTDQFIFRVPKYQRNYAWTDEHISDFISDLRKCHAARGTELSRHHFFGGIVSVETKIPGSARRQCDLVDGQQRLATFILLVASIVSVYKLLKQQAGIAGDSANEDLLDQRISDLTQKYLRYRDEVNRQSVTIDRLEVSGADAQYFKDIVQEQSRAATRESHRRLDYSYATIRSYIQNEVVDPLSGLTDQMDALKRFEEILNEDFTVIHIVTGTKREAYRLFQVLNDRGTGLTEGDLLRSKTMELLEPVEYSDQQTRVENGWNDILGDPYEMTDDFLRWYYSSVKGKRPSASSLLDDYLDAFFPQHRNNEETAKSDQEADAVVKSVNELQEEVIICRKLIDGRWPFDHAQPITQWDRNRLTLLVVELKHTNCLPLLLAAARKLDHRQFSEIVQATERFIFRYKIICNRHISPVTTIYLEEATAIRSSSDANPYRISSLKVKFRDLLNSSASDSIFRSNLDELEYRTRGSNKPLKYFLMTMENYARWYYDGATGEPTCMDRNQVFDFANTSIEHVYPQNPSVQHQPLDELVNSLGNLTFLSPDDNQNASNDDYPAKHPIFQQSSVLLNRKLAEYTGWDKANLEARQQEMLTMAVSVFSI